MRNYWNTLNERERWMLIIAGLCLSIYLFYSFIYAPLKNSLAAKSAQLVEKKDTLIWMQQAKAAKHSVATRKNLNNRQLLTLLSDQLKTGHLQKYAHQMEQTSAGDVQLSFNEVPFQTLLTWLENLSKTYVISVKQLNAERTETRGVVKLTLVVSASH